jgi:hypothetical protein
MDRVHGCGAFVSVQLVGVLLHGLGRMFAVSLPAGCVHYQLFVFGGCSIAIVVSCSND